MTVRKPILTQPLKRGTEIAVMADLHIEKREEGRILILDLQGAIELGTAPQLSKKIHAALDNRVEALVLNLSEVSQIDMSGLATLIEASEIARNRNKQFALFGLQSAAKKVFEVAKLEQGFQLYENEAAALQAVKIS